MTYIIMRDRHQKPLVASWNAISQTRKKNKDIYGVNLVKLWILVENGKFIAAYNKKDWDFVGKTLAKKCMMIKHF